MNNIKKSAIAGVLALAASQAWATEGTIQFTGAIIDSTCEFSGSDTVNVELGHYGKNQFKSVGDRTPKIPVTIPLKNCPTTPWEHLDGTDSASFRLWLETRAGGTVKGADGDLIAVSSMGDTAATGVGIQIESAVTSNVIPPNKLSDESFAITGANMNLELQAYYVSTVASTAITSGEANAAVDVTLDYR